MEKRPLSVLSQYLAYKERNDGSRVGASSDFTSGNETMGPFMDIETVAMGNGGGGGESVLPGNDPHLASKKQYMT